LGKARGQIAENEQQIQALRQQLDTQAETLHQLAGQLTDAEKQLAEKQAMLQEQSQRWQQQQEQDQAWFARRILEERQFAEDKLKDKLERQALQIAALKESEAALHNAGISLRRELRGLETALEESQQNIKQPFKFKPNGKAYKKAGQGQGG
jgi:predicted  nucleic acid-binding Zn-ribbon protein